MVFKISVVWQMTGSMYIDASTLKEAEEIALFAKLLPKKQSYIEDSIELDKDHIDYGKLLEEIIPKEN